MSIDHDRLIKSLKASGVSVDLIGDVAAIVSELLYKGLMLEKAKSVISELNGKLPASEQIVLETAPLDWRDRAIAEGKNFLGEEPAIKEIATAAPVAETASNAQDKPVDRAALLNWAKQQVAKEGWLE